MKNLNYFKNSIMYSEEKILELRLKIQVFKQQGRYLIGNERNLPCRTKLKGLN